MFRALLALSLLSLVAPHAAQAQQDATGLVPGRRIRIHQQGNQKLVGSLVSMDSASLAMVTQAGDTVRVPRGNIAGLDLSQGTKSNAGKGALTGLLIGGLGGALLGLVAASAQDQDEWFYISPAQYALGAGLTFGALGAGIGALAGSGKRTDKWAPTAWPTLSFQPSRRDGGTVALGMHLTF